MRFTFAILIGRIVRFLGKFVDRATNLPGEIAIRICPDFLARFKFDGKVIAVTGSNGKTTTTNMIAHILRENGHTVAINTEGSNLSAGIATTLLVNSTMSGRMKQDFVVLEIDERFSPIVFKRFVPDIFVVNNLFRDQVVRNGNPDIIYEKIKEAVKPSMTMVVNGNDPISQRLAENNPHVYFGMDKTVHSIEKQVFLTDDCKVCPKCFHKLEYAYYHYNHIGKFKCNHCGYATPKIDFLAHDVDFDGGKFKINGSNAVVTYKTTFHVINTTAAIAACVKAGVSIDNAIKGAARFKVSKVRYDEMTLCGDRKGVLMLTKQNPTSLDQSISFAIEQEEEKVIVLYLNNVLYTENKDISWIYDVTFERLKGEVKHIVCSGSRAYDLAVRLKQGGFTNEEIIVSDDLSTVRKEMSKTKGAIYILAASAFGNEDGILEALK